MSEKEESYKLAYEEIIDYLIDSCTSNKFSESDKKYAGFGGSFINCSYRDDPKPEKGDLIRLGSAFNKEFRLSWYLDERRHYYEDEDGTKSTTRYESEWLLKSIKTGNLCWWSNVSLSFFDREKLKEWPQWKWNDRQFEFKDKWWKVCYKEKDAYITLPLLPEFGEGHEVTLGTRTRFGMDDYKPTKTFSDYRKLTKKILGEFYDECVNNRLEKKNG